MKNIYTYCLRKGYESEDGFTYNQIKNEIISKFNKDFTPNFELGFRIWFFSNFFEETAENNLDYQKVSSHSLRVDKSTGHIPFEGSIDKVVYLKGDATLKYLDYLELTDARRSSRRAFLFSIISISIAVCAIFIPILIKTDIKQPMEVRIIDDIKTNSIHLNIDNDSTTISEREELINKKRLPTKAHRQ